MKKIILMKIFFSVMKIFFLWVVESGQFIFCHENIFSVGGQKRTVH